MVGSAVVRLLQARGFTNLITATRAEVDLRDPAAVRHWFADTRPEYVVHVAGLVGGILANSTRQADFLYDNMMMHGTVLRSAHDHAVAKLLYLGSSCIYPRDCPQPIKEEYLLTGPLEETNYGYAIAKISGLKSCQAYRDQFGSHFISAMPTNLYGPNDNFDPLSSHVLPGLIQRFHAAKAAGQRAVTLWGTGTPLREFLHVDDLAEACLFLLEHYDEREPINVGSGEEVSIAQLADTIRQVVYPEAEIAYDPNKPDGTPRKLLDCSRLTSLGWQARTPLAEGIARTYAWYLESGEAERRA
jgi:GDP-L-fucose synthase